jgi:ADP-heptose:LPS heptosyltransferase
MILTAQPVQSLNEPDARGGESLYTNIAIVKPDHIGDLILASPAIGWLLNQAPSAALYVQKTNVRLAKYLFPEAEVRTIDFPHLDRNHGPGSYDAVSVLAGLQGHDMVVFLRNDQYLNRDRLGHLVDHSIFAESNDQRHESQSHRLSLRPYFGNYERDKFWPGQLRPFPSDSRVVGLCLSAGYPTNRWSIIRWTELARRLLEKGKEIRLIGGPWERPQLQIVADAIGAAPSDVFIGGEDVESFLREVAGVDVVIATDGGGGHLCSLAAPILTIAASVPFRRFAAYGSQVRVVSLDLPCSPCMGWHDTQINKCFTHECSFGIQATDVLEALDAPHCQTGTVTMLKSRATLFYGPSHA